MINDLWKRKLEGLLYCPGFLSCREEIRLESFVCMGTRASAHPCNSLETFGAVGYAACSMREQRAKSTNCRIKSRSFISLPVCWGGQHQVNVQDSEDGHWGPFSSMKKAIRKFLKTSVKSFSGWPALCCSNEHTCWEGAIVLHKPAAPELCVVKLVLAQFKAAVSGLGILWLLSEGLHVLYSRNSWSCSCCAALEKQFGEGCWQFLLRGCLLWVFFPFLLPMHWIPGAMIYRNSNMKGTLQGIISIWAGCSSRIFGSPTPDTLIWIVNE